MIWKRLSALMGALMLVIGLAAAPAFAGQTDPDGILIDVRASSAPNAFGSPSWSSYASNALNSLRYGTGNIGNPSTDPASYTVLGNRYHEADLMVTSFTSWAGLATPSGAFAGEYGQRMHFGLAAVGDGSSTFTLADVNFWITSTDNALDYSGTLAGTTLNGTTRVGQYYGADRTAGTSDDVWYTNNEDDTTTLDALYYVGVGNAYWPGGPGDPLSGQASLDYWSNYIRTNHISVTGGYSINGYSNQQTLAVVPLPPAAYAGGGMLLLLALIGGIKKRRRLAFC